MIYGGIAMMRMVVGSNSWHLVRVKVDERP